MVYIDDCDYSKSEYAYKANMPLRIHKYNISGYSKGGNKKTSKRIVKKIKSL